MKLGLLYRGANAILDTNRDTSLVNSHIFSLFSLLYPDEISGTISIDDPNFSMMEQFDALLYIAMPSWDKTVVEFANRIPCTFIVNPDGVPEWTWRGSYRTVTNINKIMKAADIVIIPDCRKEYISTMLAIVGNKVQSWMFPIPVDAIFEQLRVEKNEHKYDIVIPYGPYRSQAENRGGYVAAMAAQRIIDDYPEFKQFAVLNMVRVSHPQYSEICKDSRQVLHELGCRDFKILPFQDWYTALHLYNNAKLVINLDWTPSIGKVAGECALLKTPYIGTDVPNSGHYIYGDICTVHPFDIDKIVELAGLVNDNKWPNSWIDHAYEKALTLSLSNKAAELEEIVSCG